MDGFIGTLARLDIATTSVNRALSLFEEGRFYNGDQAANFLYNVHCDIDTAWGEFEDALFANFGIYADTRKPEALLDILCFFADASDAAMRATNHARIHGLKHQGLSVEYLGVAARDIKNIRRMVAELTPDAFGAEEA